MMASVTLEHVKKIYDNKVTAVQDFNLEISRTKNSLCLSALQAAESPPHCG